MTYGGLLINNIRASIDIGSNSILLLIAKFDGDDFERVLENKSYVTSLGRDLDKDGVFLDETMSDSFDVLSSYMNLCEKYQVPIESIVATATEASRVAKNAKDFYAKVADELSLEVHIISGEAEAYYSTIGILFDKKISDDVITIMDIGGASTELIQVEVESRRILSSFSMPVGAVRLTNWIEERKESKLKEILDTFSEQIKNVRTQKLYCVAGTMTSVGNMFLGHRNFMEEEVHGLKIEEKAINEMFEQYSKMTDQDLLKEFPFLGKRSKTITAGIKLALNIFEKIENKEIYISTYGLRYGTILEGRIEDEFIAR